MLKRHVYEPQQFDTYTRVAFSALDVQVIIRLTVLETLSRHLQHVEDLGFCQDTGECSLHSFGYFVSDCTKPL